MEDTIVFDEEFDGEDFEDGFEIEGFNTPNYILYEEPVDPSEYASLVHDSFGERYIHINALRERSPVVTILRILGIMQLEPRGEVQFFLNGNEVSSDHHVVAGDAIYIVGKLAGG